MLLILQPVDWDSQPPIRQFMKTWSFLILKSFIYRFLETHEIIFFPCWNFNHKWTIFFFFEKAVRAQYFLKLLESFFKKIFFPKLIYFWPHCPQYMEPSFPNQGSGPYPLQWKHRVFNSWAVREVTSPFRLEQLSGNKKLHLYGKKLVFSNEPQTMNYVFLSFFFFPIIFSLNCSLIILIEGILSQS